MGHSGGTFIGIQAAARAPELYHAYIGVAQMSRQLESERLAYDYMLQRFKDDGDARMVRKLEKAPVTDTIPLPASYGSVRDVAMHRLGIGTTHDMKSIVSGLLLPSLLSREYTLAEKISMWRGKLFSGRFLWKEQLGYRPAPAGDPARRSPLLPSRRPRLHRLLPDGQAVLDSCRRR